MGKSLFGTDGVRGRVGLEPITPATVMKLGWAAGRVLSHQGKAAGKVLIGKDTRISGYMLESALEAGFSAAGMNVSLLGPMPTPAIAYLTRTARASAGVVISASHNPYFDNGIKIFSADGTKLDDAIVARIDAKMMEPGITCVSSEELGKAERFSDAPGRYIEYCKNTFDEQLSLAGLKVVIDCANGAAYDIAPHVLTELGAEVMAIANTPDGININKDCGSTHLRNLKESVLENGADIGIALDGDADRVLLVDHLGREVNGDQILFLLASQRYAENRLGGGVAGTIMTNLGLEQRLQSMSIPFVRTPVGDRHVHEVLKLNGWFLGGEASGHIICLDKSTTGDGIVATLEVLETMLKTDRSLAELTQGMSIYPQHMVNVALGSVSTEDVMKDVRLSEAIKSVEAELGDSGRVVLRPSGTEPVVRVMIEGNQEEQVKTLTEQLAAVVKLVSD